MIIIDLPYPPSVNMYYRTPRSGKLAGRTMISEKGRMYRADVMETIMRYKLGRVPGRLEVHIDAFPPDRRRRDLDNICKGLLDGLAHAGIIADDGDIDILKIHRKEHVKGGLVRVFVSEIKPKEATNEL